MNSEVIKEFLVKLGFETDGSQLAQFSEGLTSATTRTMAFGAAITAMAAGVVASVADIAKEYKQFDLLAQELKTTTDALDDYIDTAEVLGISNETTTQSLKSLSGNIQDAAMGIGRAKIVFEKLGISATDATGKVKSTTDVMQELQLKMQGMDRAQQMRVMERLGLDPKMLIMFNASLEQTQKIGKELSAIDVATGFKLDKTIEESKAFSKSWKEMHGQITLFHTLFTKMYEAIAVSMMPKMREGVEKFSQTIEEARHFIMDNAQKIEAAFKPILEFVLRIASAFIQLGTTAFKLVIEAISPVIDFLLRANKATDGWLGIIVGVIAAWKLLNLSFLASPLGILLMLGVAVLALVDDFRVWKEGGQSAIDWNGKLGQTLRTVGEWAKYVGAAVAVGVGLWAAWTAGAIAASTTMTVLRGVMLAFHAVQGIVNAATLLFNILFRATPFGLIITGIGLVVTAGYFLVKNWTTVKNWFAETFKWFIDKFNEVGNFASKIGKAFSGMFGGGDITSVHNTRIIPSTANTNHSSVNQSTVINVNGTNNPQQVAQNVASHQANVNQQIIRNQRGSVK